MLPLCATHMGLLDHRRILGIGRRLLSGSLKQLYIHIIPAPYASRAQGQGTTRQQGPCSLASVWGLRTLHSSLQSHEGS